jgi:hypothetical protein
MKHMMLTRSKLADVFPNHQFRGYLMSVDGKVERMKVEEKDEKF